VARHGEAGRGMARDLKPKTNMATEGKMETLKLRFTGLTPLLMHNVRLSNPLDKYVAALKTVTGKRKKTIEDHIEIARIEWEGGLYLDDNGVVAVPMRWIGKCIQRGATKQKNGQLWKSGATIMEDHMPLTYAGPQIKKNGNGAIPDPDLDKFYDLYNFQTMAGVQRNKTLRTRPMFKDWSLETTIAHDSAIIERSLVIKAAEDAGRLCGMGDWRIENGGPFGRFSVEVIE
jgi:hypothetical protein